MKAINYLVAIAALTLVHMVIPSSQAEIEVTNEQLRDGLLSLVHSYSQLETKLDRHEQRERALGEIIKRGLQTLQKGQKIFEPTRGTLARLDERINQIETLLLSQDEKLSDQQTKLGKVTEIIEQLASASKSSTNPDKLNELSGQVEDLSVNVKEMRGALDEHTTKYDKNVQNAQESLLKIEMNISEKLDGNGEAIEKVQSRLQGNASLPDGSFDKITKELQALAGRACDSSSQGGSDIDKEFLVSLNNQTLEAIFDMRHEVLTASDKNFIKTTTKIKESNAGLETNINELLKNVGESSYDGAAQNALADTTESLNAIQKLEQMLAGMGDSVLSVKRGMEFNVQKITMEVSEAIKESTKTLSGTINEQFEAINETILANHNGALANLTSKIETEISQVWRQIGIMYQEVSSSKDALNKLQQLTETYVNGTSITMDSMEGKVSQITGRMGEVDSNLNYLLGRLSLVTQEFNQIKVGLGKALDSIRSSFQDVQKQIRGPGPHKIESEEYQEEPSLDFKLLAQRDQPITNN